MAKGNVTQRKQTIRRQIVNAIQSMELAARSNNVSEFADLYAGLRDLVGLEEHLQPDSSDDLYSYAWETVDITTTRLFVRLLRAKRFESFLVQVRDELSKKPNPDHYDFEHSIGIDVTMMKVDKNIFPPLVKLARKYYRKDAGAILSAIHGGFIVASSGRTLEALSIIRKQKDGLISLKTLDYIAADVLSIPLYLLELLGFVQRDKKVAPKKYSDEDMNRVGELMSRGIRVTEAIRTVADEKGYVFENFKQQYYSRKP